MGVIESTLVRDAISYIVSDSTDFAFASYVKYPKDFSAISLLSLTTIICAPGNISDSIPPSIIFHAALRLL